MKKLICFLLVISMLLSPVTGYAQVLDMGMLPKPNAMVGPSPVFHPAALTGITVNPKDPFLFDFIMDMGDSKIEGAALKDESTKLIKYFLATLALPEKDVWVNLSPTENDRIIPEGLASTEMGQEMLSQDYILKQLTSTFIHPDSALGKEFWQKVYAKAYEQFGTTDVPTDVFNKVWITTDRASVYEKGNTAYLTDSHLKVTLDEDRMTAADHRPTDSVITDNMSVGADLVSARLRAETSSASTRDFTKQVMRDVVLPAIEREVNEGTHFAPLRQIFNSMILAIWYKESLKDALVNQVYANQSKVAGIDLADPKAKDKIYSQYMESYRVGVFNFIKEESMNAGAASGRPVSNEIIPRKYFSGGITPPAYIAHAQRIDAAQVGKNEKFHVTARLQDAAQKSGVLRSYKSLILGASLLIVGGVFTFLPKDAIVNFFGMVSMASGSLLVLVRSFQNVNAWRHLSNSYKDLKERFSAENKGLNDVLEEAYKVVELRSEQVVDESKNVKIVRQILKDNNLPLIKETIKALISLDSAQATQDFDAAMNNISFALLTAIKGGPSDRDPEQMVKLLHEQIARTIGQDRQALDRLFKYIELKDNMSEAEVDKLTAAVPFFMTFYPDKYTSGEFFKPKDIADRLNEYSLKDIEALGLAVKRLVASGWSQSHIKAVRMLGEVIRMKVEVTPLIIRYLEPRAKKSRTLWPLAVRWTPFVLGPVADALLVLVPLDISPADIRATASFIGGMSIMGSIGSVLQAFAYSAYQNDVAAAGRYLESVSGDKAFESVNYVLENWDTYSKAELSARQPQVRLALVLHGLSFKDKGNIEALEEYLNKQQKVKSVGHTDAAMKSQLSPDLIEFQKTTDRLFYQYGVRGFSQEQLLKLQAVGLDRDALRKLISLATDVLENIGPKASIVSAIERAEKEEIKKKLIASAPLMRESREFPGHSVLWKEDVEIDDVLDFLKKREVYEIELLAQASKGMDYWVIRRLVWANSDGPAFKKSILNQLSKRAKIKGPMSGVFAWAAPVTAVSTGIAFYLGFQDPVSLGELLRNRLALSADIAVAAGINLAVSSYKFLMYQSAMSAAAQHLFSWVDSGDADAREFVLDKMQKDPGSIEVDIQLALAIEGLAVDSDVNRKALADELADAVKDMSVSREITDAAQGALVNGGIDLDRARLDLNVNKEGAGVEMQIDPAMAERIRVEGVSGLVPEILEIKVLPMQGLFQLLGMNELDSSLTEKV